VESLFRAFEIPEKQIERKKKEQAGEEHISTGNETHRLALDWVHNKQKGNEERNVR
jgi:hypothetical protein